MSKHHLRKDKICQNCGHEVPQRFCTSCGQENVETRQSFGHLLRHFIEDFTHYEGNFWKTIKYLMFRPAYLTKTYLAGKRVTYVAPVKLYIFVSFIAFFLPGILPHFHKEKKAPSLISTGLKKASEGLQQLDGSELEQEHNIKIGDSVIATAKTIFSDFKSPEEYDSFQNTLPGSERDNWLDQYAHRKLSYLNTIPKEIFREKFISNIVHNFPKALFVYLPMFAFIIWLFHGKKRWLYFDHAIFTLHYFSFLLLLYTILNIIKNCLPWQWLLPSGTVTFATWSAFALWNLYYLFRAHHKMYGEHRVVSWTKSLFICMISTTIFVVLLIAFFVFTVFNLH